MCNLYSSLLPRDTMRQLFRVSDNRAAAVEPMPAIFPANDAPVVRLAEDRERELVMSSWGFPLLMKGRAAKRVTNTRDDKLGSSFWAGSFRERRCLVPATSFAEPKGKRPATWHWLALDEARTPFAFAGIWRRYRGPLKADGETVEIDVHSFLTTTPNELVATVHPTRMPVMLSREDEWKCWLSGSAEEARGLIRSYPADKMMIVQSGSERRDLVEA
jgi:putative SOS response-associated peptidase YedK